MLKVCDKKNNIDALYVHIPFCLKKCEYCDFLSFSGDNINIEEYISYLCKELAIYPNYIYDTVYFGGGTPSIIAPEYIKRILDLVNLGENSEITIEINPRTVDMSKLTKYKDYGINRLSIGVQSFSDEKLKILGRIHNVEEAKETYYRAKEVGFDNISLDLMFSTPEETLEELKKDLDELFKLKPEHFSIYSLIWEEGTIFYQKLMNGILKAIDNDLESDMYSLIIEESTKNGYSHYEISNFSQEGFYSKHNTKYWKNENYVGIGLGASGYVENIRYSNHIDIRSYYRDIDDNQFPRNNTEIIEKSEKEKYAAILNLRLLKEGYFPNGEKYMTLCHELEKKGLLKKLNDNYILSDRGLFLANDVMEVFL